MKTSFIALFDTRIDSLLDFIGVFFCLFIIAGIYSLMGSLDLKRKAEKGNAKAQIKLALLYLDDSNKKYDLDAANLLRKAADQGESTAQYNLALLYMDGRGVSQDGEKAAYWLEQAANQGDKDAREMLDSIKNVDG